LPVDRPGALQLVAIGKSDISAVVVGKVQVITPKGLLHPARDADERRAVDIVTHAVVHMRADNGIGRKAPDMHTTLLHRQRGGKGNTPEPITMVTSAGGDLRATPLGWRPKCHDFRWRQRTPRGGRLPRCHETRRSLDVVSSSIA